MRSYLKGTRYSITITAIIYPNENKVSICLLPGLLSSNYSSSLVNSEGTHGILIKNTTEIKAAIILPRKRHLYDDSFAARSRQVMRKKLKIGATDEEKVRYGSDFSDNK